MDFAYKPDYDYKYQLASDGSRLVLKPNKPVKRFGGVEYLATHDFMFGAENSWSDIGICLLHYMHYFQDDFPMPKEFLRNFTKRRLEFLAKNSLHVREAIDEVIEIIELSMHYYESGLLKPKEGKCRIELLLEAETLMRSG